MNVSSNSPSSNGSDRAGDRIALRTGNLGGEGGECACVHVDSHDPPIAPDEPAQVAADVAADLEDRPGLSAFEYRGPERPSIVAGHAVALDVLIAELTGPQRLEARDFGGGPGVVVA